MQHFFQFVQTLFGCIYPVLTTISIASQTPLYDIIGEQGCIIYWLSSVLHSQSLVVGGLGMAIFRFICLENRLQEFSKDKLATIIHIVGLILLCSIATITIIGIVNAGWEQAGMYQFCRNYVTTQAGIHQVYLNLPNQDFGNL